MHPYINIAIKTVRLLGKMLVDAMLHVNISAAKKNLSLCNELTTNLESSLVEQAVHTILKAYPTHNIQSKTINQANNSEITWLIEPLNGQLNFWYGIPLFAVAIAILHGDELVHGVIYNPGSDELFFATKGTGAKLNNKRIRVSNNGKLSEALLAINTDLLLTSELSQSKNLALFPRDQAKITNLDLGSAALNLAFLATGRLDGYLDHHLNFREVAAGALIVKEAGGYVSDLELHGDRGAKVETDSSRSDLHDGDRVITGKIIAGNPKIYAELNNFVNN